MPEAAAVERVKEVPRQVGLGQLHGAKPGKSWVAHTSASGVGRLGARFWKLNTGYYRECQGMASTHSPTLAD